MFNVAAPDGPRLQMSFHPRFQPKWRIAKDATRRFDAPVLCCQDATSKNAARYRATNCLDSTVGSRKKFEMSPTRGAISKHPSQLAPLAARKFGFGAIFFQTSQMVLGKVLESCPFARPLFGANRIKATFYRFATVG